MRSKLIIGILLLIGVGTAVVYRDSYLPALQPTQTVLYEDVFFGQGIDAQGHRPDYYVARGEKAMVVSEGEPATKIAVDLLKKGASAIDAAIALSFAISVYEPHATGIGGGGFFLIYQPKTKKILAIDARERAPLKATQDMFLRNGKAVPELSRWGGLSVAVPGLVAGLEEIYKKYGSQKVSWKELVAPSIALARDGFPVYPRMEAAIDFLEEEGLLKKFPEIRKLVSAPNGALLRSGDIFRNPALAKTLETIAEKGAKGFYSGWVADEILATVKKAGGILSAQDLNRYRVKERVPVVGTYAGAEIYSMPPPSSGGVHVIQMLNVLEQKPGSLEKGFYSREGMGLKVEIMRRAFADRAAFLGDPDFVSVPTAGLLSKGYAKAVAQEIDLEAVAPAPEVKAGTPKLYNKTNTTHFSIVDNDGIAVATTQTINYLFGSALVAGSTGVILNDEMDDFSAQPGAMNVFGLVGSKANAVAPGKTPLSSMTPTIVVKNGKVKMVLGSPGGSHIITSVWNVLVNYLGHGMEIKDAVFAPRIHHQWLPDKVIVDARGFSPDAIATLKSKGYEVEELAQYIGNVSAIAVDDTNGVMTGVADPRRGGLAEGF